MDLSKLELLLDSPDTDKRIQALHQFEQLLSDPNTEIEEIERFIPLIHKSLKHANSYLSTAALGCLPCLFPRFVPLTTTLTTTSPSPSSTSRLSTSTSTTTTHSFALQNHQAYHLKQALIALLPLDKLVDSKVQVRDFARETIISAARTCLRLGIHAGTGLNKDKEGPWQYWESRVQEHAFHSKSPKAREQALLALMALRDPLYPPLAPLRPFTIFLLPLLSDADPSVRSLALSTTIKIFGSESVTAAARVDLKKAMIKADVNKRTQETILAAVLGRGAASGGDPSIERTASATSFTSSISHSQPFRTKSVGTASEEGKSDTARTTSPPTQSPGPISSTSSPPPASSFPGMANKSIPTSLPATAFPSDPSSVHAPTTEIHPIYMTNDRDVLHEFDSMKPSFEGKETEHNWIERDKNIAKIRGMTKGNAPQHHLDSFLQGLKSVLEGILKTASSLRTTVAISALSLMTELAQTLSHSLDPLLEHFMSHCLCMAGQTKKIVAQASQATVTALITHLGYHHKMLQLIWIAMNDKIASARSYAIQHVSTFVQIHGNESKIQIESTGGLEEIEKSLKKGLQDPILTVKETSRKLFWKVKEIWPKLGDKIWNSIDPTTRKALERSDPNKLGAAAAAGSSTSGGKSATPGTGRSARPSMRDLVKQAKQAKEAAPAEDNDNHGIDSLPVVSTPIVSAQTFIEPIPNPAPLSPTMATETSSRMVNTPRSISSNDGLKSSRRHSRIPVHSPTHAPIDLHRSVSSPTNSPTVPRTNRRTSRDEQEREFDSSSLFKASSPFRIEQSLQRDDSLDLVTREARSGSAVASDLSSLRRQESSLVKNENKDDRMTSTTRGGMRLPITEPIVDDALRDQAEQAEQAAQRLLELAHEDEDEIHAHGNGYKKTPASTLRSIDVFADSPDLRNGDGAENAVGNGKGKNWWMKKTDQVKPHYSSALPPDSAERLNEIDSLISAFASGQASSSDIRRLAQISTERPIYDNDIEESSAVQDGSPLAHHSVTSSSSSASTKFWDDRHRFKTIWETLSTQLLSSSSPAFEESKEALLLLFKSLITHQLPCFAGSETSVFNLLLQLRSIDPSRSTIGAIEGISTTFCSTSEPLFSLSSLEQSLTHFLESSLIVNGGDQGQGQKALAFSLGLRALAQLFERLPPEILEDVLPRSISLIKKGLEDRSGEVRRASIATLTSVYKVLKDETKLFELVGELPNDRKNLLAYYIAKLPPSTNV